MDFIQEAKILLDTANNEWFFKDELECNFLPERRTKISIPVAATQEVTTPLRPNKGDNSQRLKMKHLFSEFECIFAASKEPTTFAEYTIKLSNDTPAIVPQYRLSPVKKEFLQRELEKMLTANISEEWC
ncbi:hypothetical protein CBL_10786, partial [Carabus blaptoides fortunei]